MCDPAWISKFLGGLGLTQGSISSLTKNAWQNESRKSLWSNIGRLYTFARNQRQPGLILGEFIQAELIKNNQDPCPRNFLLTCGVNVDELREKYPRKKTRPPVRSKIEFFAPLPADFAANAHFTTPANTEISDAEALEIAAEASPPHNQEYLLAYSETGEPPHWQADWQENWQADRYVDREMNRKMGDEIEDKNYNVALKESNKHIYNPNSRMGNPPNFLAQARVNRRRNRGVKRVTRLEI